MLGLSYKPTPWCPGIRRSNRLARGLVAYWPMWEGAGGKVFDLVNGHMDALNGPIWAPSGLLYVDQDYIDCGGRLAFPAWTFVVRLRTETAAAKAGIISWGTELPSIMLRFLNDQPLIYLGAQNFRYFAAQTYDYSQMTFAFSVPGDAQTDINNAHAWLNGLSLAVSSTKADGAQAAKGDCWIGSARDTMDFQGRMDFACLYNRALSVKEGECITGGDNCYSVIRPLRCPWPVSGGGPSSSSGSSSSGEIPSSSGELSSSSSSGEKKAIMNLLQGANMGADLYDGTFLYDRTKVLAL